MAGATVGQGYNVTNQSNPARSVVDDGAGAWVATFTRGSRTVTIAGPARVFAESSAAATVTSRVWVRLLPEPFDGNIDWHWLEAARTDPSPDVLETAMQYVAGTPPQLDNTGLQYAGDAAYGAIGADGTLQTGADFNDYLGLTWHYPTSIDSPEPEEFLSLDCSGFVRMVFGYRFGVPLGRSVNGTSLPRTSHDMSVGAPGTVVVPNRGTQITKFGTLMPGDLVFFDATTSDGTQIDHVGIYLGLDSARGYRFISSRKSSDGPTLGDYRGASLLNGTGLYAKSFRAVRRL
ncbi:MAG TPA: NlpC/P60 family protein [Fimbriimonas sp.]